MSRLRGLPAGDHVQLVSAERVKPKPKVVFTPPKIPQSKFVQWFAGKLRYVEAGKEVFSVGPAEIKEIDANSVLGYNTGTFHVILNSGPTYNFAPASLSISDGQKMLDSLKRALH